MPVRGTRTRSCMCSAHINPLTGTFARIGGRLAGLMGGRNEPQTTRQGDRTRRTGCKNRRNGQRDGPKVGRKGRNKRKKCQRKDCDGPTEGLEEGRPAGPVLSDRPTEGRTDRRWLVPAGRAGCGLGSTASCRCGPTTRHRRPSCPARRCCRCPSASRPSAMQDMGHRSDMGHEP